MDRVRTSPLERARRAAPFGAVALFAFLILPAELRTPHEPAVLAAIALTILIALVELAAPWHRIPRALRGVPAFSFLLVVALLRHAEGGAISVYGPLVLLPIVWFSLYGSRAELIVAIAGTGLIFALPVHMFGNAAYPGNELRRALVFIVVSGLIGLIIQQLVGKQKQLLSQLAELARTDELTGLWNRRFWEEALPAELARAVRNDRPLTIAMIDLDRFKAFNDHRGHQAGDRLLKQAAGAWRAELRANDVLARFGGEEFALAFPGCSIDVATRLAERLRLATPAGQTCSIGLGQWDGRERPSDLLERTDAALYAAKLAGRNRVIASPSEPGASPAFSA